MFRGLELLGFRQVPTKENIKDTIESANDDESFLICDDNLPIKNENDPI